MFGISFAELAVVFVVALLLFGPDKLPEIAKSLGQLFSQLKSSTEGLRDEFYRELSAPSEGLRKLSGEIAHEARRIKEEVAPLEVRDAQGGDASKDPPHD